MSVVFEDENKVVNVKLTNNDFILVGTCENNGKTLKITNKDNELVVEEVRWKSEKILCSL